MKTGTQKLFIYGISSFAKQMHYYLTKESGIEKYEVVAFCVDKKFKTNDTFCNLPVIEYEEIQKHYPPEKYVALVVIGYSKMRNRKIMYDKIKMKNYTLINYFHPSVEIRNLKYGDNNIILSQCCIEPFVQIGDNNIIWTSSTICHDTKIQNNNFIAAKTLIGGNCTIENNCFLGFNSTVVQNTNIANETLVGSKSLILKNTTCCNKYIGIPAKSISSHKEKGIEIS